MMMGRSEKGGRSGDHADYDRMVKDHFERIYNLALLRTGRRDLAEDVTQETFIRAYRGLKSFRGDSALSTWVYRIALNVCHSTLKKESRYLTANECDPGSAMEMAAGSEQSAETTFLAADRHTRIREAIQELTPPQADAITLYYLREYSYTEVAAIMQQPLGTVKSHLHRGKKRLKELLEGVIL